MLTLHGSMGGYDQGLILARTAGVPGLRYIAPSRPGYPERCRGLIIISSFFTRTGQGLPMGWYLVKLAVRFGPLVEVLKKRKARQDPERASLRAIPDPVMRVRTLNDPEAGPLLRELQLITYDRLPLRIPGSENDIALSSSEFSIPIKQLKAPLLVVHGTKDRRGALTWAASSPTSTRSAREWGASSVHTPPRPREPHPAAPSAIEEMLANSGASTDRPCWRSWSAEPCSPSQVRMAWRSSSH